MVRYSWHNYSLLALVPIPSSRGVPTVGPRLLATKFAAATLYDSHRSMPVESLPWCGGFPGLSEETQSTESVGIDGNRSKRCAVGGPVISVYCR